MLQHRGLNLWKDVPMDMKNLTFSKFKKSYLQDKCFKKIQFVIEITLYCIFFFFFIFRSHNRRLWKSVGVC